jgi:hypothetical protein
VGDKKVLYNTQTVEGIAYENDKKLTDSENRCYKKGNDYFNNDSFWLIAPFKLRDAGTTRSIVMQDNQEATDHLRFWRKYTGDSYMWFVDQNYRPKAWRMGYYSCGLETTWENWKTFQNI